MPALLMKFAKNKSAAATIEYMIIGALTLIAIISALIIASDFWL